MEEEYNIQQTEEFISNAEAPVAEKPAKYFVGFAAGLFVSVFLGALVGGICCWLESVYYWVVVIATLLIGLTVQGISKRSNFCTAIMSSICSVPAVFVFTYVIESQGYTWSDGTPISENIWLYVIFAVLVGGWAGWKDYNKN